MDLGFEGKVAVITGGVGGMGEASARILSDGGARIVIADILDDGGEALADDLNDAIYVHTDVSSQEDVGRLVDRALEAFGTIDILINTAGVPGRGVGSPANVEGWDEIFAVHVRGTAACMEEVTRRVMIPNRYGKIVNITSLCSQVGRGGSAYCAAKAAISQFTKGNARRLGHYGINLNCVSPGSVHTPMTVATYANPQQVERIKSEIVFGRTGTGEDIVYPIVFLCSDRAGWMVGADLNVSAGQVIY